MYFRRDMDDQDRVWVDRGIDSRVDNFEPCDRCNESLREVDPFGREWHDIGDGLCPECRVDFQAHALAADLFGFPRPFNIENTDRTITNDELEARPSRGEPSALEYFVDTQDDFQGI